MKITVEFLREELKGVEAQANEQGARFQQALGACGVLKQLIAHAEKSDAGRQQIEPGSVTKVDDLSEVNPNASEPDN